MYDHRDKTAFSLADCEGVVGKAAVLPLTGRIIDASESRSGAYVRFETDERWGFGSKSFVVDLDALDLIHEEPSDDN